MTPADFTLPTPGANPLGGLPDGRFAGGRLLAFIWGLAYEGGNLKKKTAARYGELGQNIDTRRARHAQSYPIRARHCTSDSRP